jgi:hypothetical protein
MEFDLARHFEDCNRNDDAATVHKHFTASADRADFFFGPIKAGIPLKIRFFAAYWLRGAQIARLHVAFWPPKEAGL